jgi:predicted acylesterase/phospholipase RssA
VAASCAIPRLFAPIRIDGTWYADGGIADRTALGEWRAFRGDRPTLVHLVERSRSTATVDTGDLPVVHTPKARAQLWGLGDFEGELEHARRLAMDVIAPLIGRERRVG